MPLQEQEEATATAKIKPVLNLKTSEQQLDYAQDELVNHHTEPIQKDTSVHRHRKMCEQLQGGNDTKSDKNISHFPCPRLADKKQYKDFRRVRAFSTVAPYGALGCTHSAINARRNVATYLSPASQEKPCWIGYIRAEDKLIHTKHSTSQLMSARHVDKDANLHSSNV